MIPGQIDILDALAEQRLRTMTRDELVELNEADRAACVREDGTPVLPVTDDCAAGRHKRCQHVVTGREPVVCFCSHHYSTDDLRLMAQERAWSAAHRDDAP